MDIFSQIMANLIFTKLKKEFLENGNWEKDLKIINWGFGFRIELSNKLKKKNKIYYFKKIYKKKTIMKIIIIYNQAKLNDVVHLELSKIFQIMKLNKINKIKFLLNQLKNIWDNIKNKVILDWILIYTQKFSNQKYVWRETIVQTIKIKLKRFRF